MNRERIAHAIEVLKAVKPSKFYMGVWADFLFLPHNYSVTSGKKALQDVIDRFELVLVADDRTARDMIQASFGRGYG